MENKGNNKRDNKRDLNRYIFNSGINRIIILGYMSPKEGLFIWSYSDKYRGCSLILCFGVMDKIRVYN